MDNRNERRYRYWTVGKLGLTVQMNDRFEVSCIMSRHNDADHHDHGHSDSIYQGFNPRELSGVANEVAEVHAWMVTFADKCRARAGELALLREQAIMDVVAEEQEADR